MKLSIVTVCYNAEKCIETTIQSVLNQTMQVYEYIIVDGGSTDLTYKKVCSYDNAFADKGVKYHHISEKDRGISDAFNKGILMATGDIIGLINADDELLPESCRTILEIAEQKEADVYYGNCIWQDTRNQIEYVSKPKHDLKQLLYNMILIHPSTFVKKNAYDECGIFDITYKYCMDKELLYRFFKQGKQFVYVDAELTKFKSGGVSDTHTRAVFKEGSRMALDNGAPYYMVKLMEIKKIAKTELVKQLKKTSLYVKLKNKR